MTSVNSFRSAAKGLFTSVLFVKEGNVLFAVLPYCFLNCALFAIVAWGEQSGLFHVSFSPNGHGLMTLLVSFLVISKVNLAYDRFREARRAVGDGFLRLRELCQLVVTTAEAAKAEAGQDDKQEQEIIETWKSACVDRIMDLLDKTNTIIQSNELARQLARNEIRDDGVAIKTVGKDFEDPMTMVQALRLHMYLVNDNFQLLERVTLINKLGEFVTDYRQCLQLASTPLPFGLVQMGRVFLCIWTFTMPFVLREGPFSDMWSAMVFLFFLTYGFIGLELVAMNLSSPFGDGPNDIRVSALRDAVFDGIERDMAVSNTMGIEANIKSMTSRRSRFSQQKNANNNASFTRAADDPNDANLITSSSYYHLP